MATTHKVEIAFATDPDAVTPTWTDVTAYVWAASGGLITINRGNADRFSAIDPSTLSLTLDNHDGRFTPGYTSGAYYPNVVLGKKIRISTSTGAGFTERFVGYVNSWPMQWAPSGRYAEAQITAVDRMARLGRQLSADNLISTYYLASSPSDYWMFADAAGTVTPYNRITASATAVQPGFWTQVPYTGWAVTYGAATGPGTDGLTAMQINGTSLGSHTSATYTFSETQSLSVSCYVRSNTYQSTASAAAISPFYFWAGTGTSADFGVDLHPLGSDIECTTSGGTNLTSTGTLNVLDGLTHHIAGVFQGLGAGLGGTMLLYIDGVLETSVAVPTASLSGAGISAPLAMLADDFGDPAVIYSCAHFAVFPSALSAATVLNLANSGLNGFAGESTLQRTARIGALAGVTPVTTGTAGTQSMSAFTDVNGADYLTLLRTVAETEQGLLFTQTNGSVRLRPRRDMQNQTSKWTLTTGQYDSDLTFLLDDFGVVNDVTATRPDGNPYHATNSASITANGTYSQSTSLETTSDLEVVDYATWTLSNGTPAVRCSQVSVNLLTQPSLVATWLTMELGDVMSCTGLPSTAPASSVTMQVQGWTETIALDNYEASINTVPYYATNIFIFDDATYGKFDGPVFAY